LRRPINKPVVAGELDAEVFCNQNLLTEIIQHLFGNAVDPRHALDQTIIQPVSIYIEVSTTQQDIVIKVINDGTKMRSPIGRGIGYFDRYVRNYGGSLTGRTIQDQSPWTYEARLTLPRYRPVYPALRNDYGYEGWELQ